MAVLAAIAFAALLLEDDHFVALYKRSENLADYLCPLEGGCANLYFVVGLSEENTVEFNCVAFFCLLTEIENIQELFSFSFELLSLNFYNCVHLLINCITGYSVGRTA